MPVDNDGDWSLTELISSLLDRIPKLLSFKSKWSSIRVKLADLKTHLSGLASSSSNQLALDLLVSVRETIHDAVSVAARCEGPDLLEGKLRTQSDVESVMARLDRHVKDAEVLIKSGLLLIQISISSKKEAVARNLVIRLQIGEPESKNSAIESLLDLLQDDDKNVMISVAQGVVPVLVRLLDSCSLSMKEKIVAVISRISTVESSKHVLIAEGLSLLNHLLRVLESGSGFAKEKACIALQALSLSKENARAISCRGGISSLLEICQAGIKCLKSFWDSVSDAKSLEVGVVLLKNLALCPIVRVSCYLGRVYPTFGSSVELWGSWCENRCCRSCFFARVQLEKQKEIGESGCIGALIDMLDGKAMKEKEAASKALSTLLVCASNRKIFEKSDKGILSLVQLLDLKITKLDKRYTVTALELLVTSKKYRKQVVAAGACLHLQKLVTMDVEGAKKLAENLARSRIWGPLCKAITIRDWIRY